MKQEPIALLNQPKGYEPLVFEVLAHLHGAREAIRGWLYRRQFVVRWLDRRLDERRPVFWLDSGTAPGHVFSLLQVVRISTVVPAQHVGEL